MSLEKDFEDQSSMKKEEVVIHEHVPSDPTVLARVRRKLDAHILPWIFLLWLLAFIDRSNIGNAKIDGLVTDLHLDGNKYNISLTIFYVLYVLVDVPSNMLLKKVGGGIYLPLLALCFGIVSTCMGAVRSYGGLLACRLLLGACEGGMFGGVILYLSMFYRRHDLMLRLGVFYCAAPLSGAFGGLLATGLAQIRFHGYNRWPWIFFVEGAITISVALAAIIFLPHTPSQAQFLTEDERLHAVHSLLIDLRGTTQTVSVEEERFSWSDFRMALLNINTIAQSLNFFLILIPIYSFSLFLPTIIKDLGYQAVEAQLLTVPPNFLAFIIVLVAAYLSDRIRMRGPVVAVCLLIAAVGYIMELASDRVAVRYAGTFFIAVGAFPCSPLVLAWLSNNLAPHYVRAIGLGFQVAFGNCGAFVATWTYLSQNAPKYTVGHAINLGAIGLSLILTCSSMAYIRWENAARERVTRDDEGVQQGQPEKVGHQHPAFRYTL